MAKIIEDRIIVTLSRIIKDSDGDLDPVLDEEKLETLTEAIEGLVDDESVVVELTQ